MCPFCLELRGVLQEFHAFETNPKEGLKLENVDVPDRTCVVSAHNDVYKQSVYLKIIFPSLYPLAAPSFELLPKTSISPSLQSQLKEVRRLF
jgi:ubiquitin-protein ligase